MGWELLLAVKPTRVGYLVRDGVRIDYTVAGKKYSRYLPAQLVICTAPKYLNRNRCPFPG